ncbi:MAG: RNA polymerase sigma factor [Tepidanaerobacteraceae bacterium]|jgi:RNA polymerase sigma factor (sigma-70 family)|nr:RNA polymerase sigma factor [Bacteroidales bacterium]
MEDGKIIELFFQRSENAIVELSAKYGAISMNTAYNILGNHQDAEECVNDSYLGVWNAVPPKTPNPLLAFLLKIVRNISINRCTYNSRQKRNNQYYVCVDELDYSLASNETVESQLEAAELTKYIEDFLDTLNKTNRLIFIRRYWYVDSYESIAKLTGLRENAIRTRLSRIRNELKKHLQERGVIL